MTKIDKLVEFLKEEEQWAYEYINSEDYINGCAEIFEVGCINTNNIFIGIEGINKKLSELSELELLELCNEPDITHNYYIQENEIWSYGIGEYEHQLDDKYDDLIKNMSEKDIEKACDKANVYIKHECIYLNYDYSRVYITLNENKVIEYFSKFKSNPKSNIITSQDKIKQHFKQFKLSLIS